MMLHKGDEPVPDYRLERRLGKGSYGEVWLASAPGGTSVAMKFIDLSSRPGIKELRGLQRMQQIRHAHLVPIYALWGLDDQGNLVGKLDSEFFLADTSRPAETMRATMSVETFTQECPRFLVVAMALADKTLLDRLEECREQGLEGIPIEELLDYMEQAGRGLDFLNAPRHDLGDGQVAIQHCDIKPANLLLVGDSIVICDYALAWVISDNAATATSVGGTLAYIAPECLDKRPGLGTDQYSLAVTYYELRTGSLPYAEPLSLVSMMEAHRKGELDFSKLPPREREVIKRATALKAKDRYPSVGEMVRALRRAVERDSQPEKPVVKRVLIAAAAVLLVGVLAGTGYWKWWPRPVPTVVIGDNGQAHADDSLDDKTTDEKKKNGSGDSQAAKTGQGEVVKVAPPAAAELAQQALAAWQGGDADQAVQLMAQAIRADRAYARPAPDRTLTDFGGAEGKAPVERLLVSPDGRWLLAYGDRPAAYLWDTRSLDQPAVALNGHQEVLSSAAFSHDSRWAMTGSLWSNAAWLWDLNDPMHKGRDLLQLTDGIGAVAISPDDRWAAAGGVVDRKIRLWDLRTNDPTPVELSGHKAPLKQLLFDASGQALVSLGDGEALLHWSLAGDPRAIEGRMPKQLTAEGVRAIALSATSRLAAGGENGQVTFFDLTGDNRPLTPDMPLHDDHIEAATAGPEDDTFATGDASGGVALWMLANGQPHGRLLEPHAAAVVTLAFTPDGRWLASGSWDGQAHLYLLDSESTLLPLALKHPQRVTSVAISPDSRWLWTAGEDGVLRAWDLSRCELLQKAAAQAANDLTL
jgi:WD40 repeat protein/serine/threonine protein kinase